MKKVRFFISIMFINLLITSFILSIPFNIDIVAWINALFVSGIIIVFFGIVMLVGSVDIFGIIWFHIKRVFYIMINSPNKKIKLYQSISSDDTAYSYKYIILLGVGGANFVIFLSLILYLVIRHSA